MKRTYNRTLFVDKLEEAKIEISVLSGCKYIEEVDELERRTYTGVKEWSIIEGGEEAEEIEKEYEADEFHEYLQLSFVDGTHKIFKNSHVSMFIW